MNRYFSNVSAVDFGCKWWTIMKNTSTCNSINRNRIYKFQFSWQNYRTRRRRIFSRVTYIYFVEIINRIIGKVDWLIFLPERIFFTKLFNQKFFCFALFCLRLRFIVWLADIYQTKYIICYSKKIFLNSHISY